MKLFFPIDAFYPSQIGGPCNSVYWLTDELCHNDFQVQVFTSTLGIKTGLVETNKYVTTYYGNVYYDDEKKYFKKLRLIYSGIKNNDILHINGIFSKSSLFSFFISRFFFRKKKVLISARGELSEKALIYNKSQKDIVLFFYKLFSSGVFFHSTSEEESKEIKTVFGKVDIFELPNYFKTNKRFLIKNKNKELLYIGRIHHKKAIHKIIEGLFLSESFKKSEYKFIIVGNHEERHQDYFELLQDKIREYNLEDKIQFKGFKEGEEKEMIYASSYMTLMLSENENFGNVAIESLNQGTPVIASTGTPWAILPQNNCGYHIDNSPEIIASIIDEVLGLSNEEYSKMCDSSVKLVDDNFMMKTKISNWLAVYNQIHSS